MQGVGIPSPTVPTHLQSGTATSGPASGQVPAGALSFSGPAQVPYLTAPLTPLPLAALPETQLARAQPARPARSRAATAFGAFATSVKATWNSKLEQIEAAKITRLNAEIQLLDTYESLGKQFAASQVELANAQQSGELVDPALIARTRDLRESLVVRRNDVIELLHKHNQKFLYAPSPRQIQDHIERLRSFDACDGNLHLPKPNSERDITEGYFRNESTEFAVVAAKKFCRSVTGNSIRRGMGSIDVLTREGGLQPAERLDVLSGIRGTVLNAHDCKLIRAAIFVDGKVIRQDESLLERLCPELTLDQIDVQRIAEQLTPAEIARINSGARAEAVAWSHPPGLWQAIRGVTARGQEGILAGAIHRVIPSGSNQVRHAAVPQGIADLIAGMV